MANDIQTESDLGNVCFFEHTCVSILIPCSEALTLLASLGAMLRGVAPRAGGKAQDDTDDAGEDGV